MDAALTPQEYIRKVLEAYRTTPGTTGVVRRPDRLLAAQLYQRGIPLLVIQNALTLAAARRMARPPNSPPLPTIRSLHYFQGAIDEVAQLQISQDYFRYLRLKIERSAPRR